MVTAGRHGSVSWVGRRGPFLLAAEIDVVGPPTVDKRDDGVGREDRCESDVACPAIHPLGMSGVVVHAQSHFRLSSRAEGRYVGWRSGNQSRGRGRVAVVRRVCQRFGKTQCVGQTVLESRWPQTTVRVNGSLAALIRLSDSRQTRLPC